MAPKPRLSECQFWIISMVGGRSLAEKLVQIKYVKLFSSKNAQISNILAYVQGALQLISAMDGSGLWCQIVSKLQLGLKSNSYGGNSKTVEALGPGSLLLWPSRGSWRGWPFDNWFSKFREKIFTAYFILFFLHTSSVSFEVNMFQEWFAEITTPSFQNHGA